LIVGLLTDPGASVAQTGTRAADAVAAESTELAGMSAAEQRRAFAAFESLPVIVELPTADAADPVLADLLGPREWHPEVALGPFFPENLVDLKFRLAVPPETLAGRPFEAEIAAGGEALGDRCWEIRQSGEPGPPTGLREPDSRIASLAVRDGVLVLQIDRDQFGRRSLSILRRCVILISARNPADRQISERELRLVKPVQIAPLKVDIFGPGEAVAIPVPGGIASRDVIEDRSTDVALPVRGVEIEAEWCGRHVIMRLPENATERPGVGVWDVLVATPTEGLKLPIRVTLSLPQATLGYVPRPAAGRQEPIDPDRMARLRENGPEPLAAIEKAFRLRVQQCPGRRYGRGPAAAGPNNLVGAWFYAPFATEEVMTIALPGHDTVRTSMDLYLREEHARAVQKVRERWEGMVAEMRDDAVRRKEEYLGPNGPKGVPPDFAAWQADCKMAPEADWDACFNARMDGWADWFWPLFQAEWRRQVAEIREADSEAPELRILGITSIAYDDRRNERRVPLVACPQVASDVKRAPAK